MIRLYPDRAGPDDSRLFVRQERDSLSAQRNGPYVLRRGKERTNKASQSPCSIITGVKLSREANMIVDGAMVPVIAIGFLAVIWVVVLYGSRYFGPKTD
jgi:hypothetical protein